MWNSPERRSAPGSASRVSRRRNESGGALPKSAAWRYALVGALCALLPAACGKAPEGPPHVLLITVDTLRADRLGCYGREEAETPNIDALAGDGVLFEFAHCDVTWTLPSMSSTFTGTLAPRHGVRSYYDVLVEEQTTLAEILSEIGYQTAAVVGAYPVESIFGFSQGFDHYDQEFTDALFHDPGKKVRHVESKRGKTIAEQMEFAFEKMLNDSWRSDDEVTNAALEMLSTLRASEKPFFFWVHYYGPHSHPDATVHGKENNKKHLATYSLKVTNTDYQVGRLLDALDEAGLRDRTLVILHSDHGESLGEHGFIGHGAFLYQDNLRVPLIMRWPGRIPAGARVPGLAGNIDIAPTILEAAGAGVRAGDMDGESLFRVIREGGPVREEAYFETYMPAHFGFTETFETPEGKVVEVGVRRRGILRPPWKYILNEAFPIYADEVKEIAEIYRKQATREQLFNLENDPGEKENLVEAERETVKLLAAELSKYAAGAQPSGERKKNVMPEDHLEKLRSLGYVE